jgi:hypothetical protein
LRPSCADGSPWMPLRCRAHAPHALRLRAVLLVPRGCWGAHRLCAARCASRTVALVHDRRAQSATRAPPSAAGASEQAGACHRPAGRASCAGAQQQSPRSIARRARWPRASQGCELAAPRTEWPRRQYHHDLKRTTREHSCTRRRMRRVRTRGRAAAKMRAVLTG